MSQTDNLSNRSLECKSVRTSSTAQTRLTNVCCVYEQVHKQWIACSRFQIETPSPRVDSSARTTSCMTPSSAIWTENVGEMQRTKSSAKAFYLPTVAAQLARTLRRRAEGAITRPSFKMPSGRSIRPSASSIGPYKLTEKIASHSIPIRVGVVEQRPGRRKAVWVETCSPRPRAVSDRQLSAVLRRSACLPWTGAW